MTSAFPPAFWIFSRADLENKCAETCSGRFQFAVAKDLQSRAQFLHQAAGDEKLRRNLFFRFEILKIFQVHDGVKLAKNVGKAPLGKAAVERHLPAFEARPHAHARP